jgi:hypothetical protein
MVSRLSDFNGVVGGIRDSHRCFFEQFIDKFCLSTYICKFGPCSLVVVWVRFSCEFVELFYDWGFISVVREYVFNGVKFCFLLPSLKW